jgi:hypothetical protein
MTLPLFLLSVAFRAAVLIDAGKLRPCCSIVWELDNDTWPSSSLLESRPAAAATTQPPAATSSQPSASRSKPFTVKVEPLNLVDAVLDVDKAPIFISLLYHTCDA